MVGLGGFEPPTSPLSGVRSNQLSYGPDLIILGKRNEGGGTRHTVIWFGGLSLSLALEGQPNGHPAYSAMVT